MTIQRLFLIIFISIYPLLTNAGQWVQLDGEAIQSVLTDKEVIYEGERSISQAFHASGKTTYVDARPSFGNWKVSMTQYCSQWPPSREWTCYDVYRDKEINKIRFIAQSGQVWEAAFKH